MINLDAPIRTKDGREATYLGELPDGTHVIASKVRPDIWCAYNCGMVPIERDYENIPPAPPKLTGFCPVLPSGDVWGKRETLELKVFPKPEYAIDLSTLTEKNFVRVEK
jgi:hypothetical protein